jgi:hypothetical protein
MAIDRLLICGAIERDVEHLRGDPLPQVTRGHWAIDDPSDITINLVALT